MTATPPIAKEELEKSVGLVVVAYRDVLSQGAPSPTDDPKAFVAWHAACRAALAHLEHLLKLLKAAGGGAEAMATGLDMLAEAASDMGPPEPEE